MSEEYDRGRNGRRRSPEELAALIRANSRVTDAGCHQWTGPVMNRGYGRLNWKTPEGKVIHGAHRIAYWVMVEPVPDGMVIDHLCRNRLCVNPEHLEPVVQRENVMRSPIAIGAANAAKTHCAKGHEFTDANTYVYEMKPPRHCTVRICRTCRNEYYQRRRAQRMGKAVSA